MKAAMQIAIVLALVALASCQIPCSLVKVRGCPGITSKASLIHVFIEGCTEEPCVFKKGTNVTMEMDIEFLTNVATLEAQLIAYVFGVPVRWDGVNVNGCEDIVSFGGCPFKPNDYITYGVELGVQALFPTITADVQYKLLDENKEHVICWMVRASVEEP